MKESKPITLSLFALIALLLLANLSWMFLNFYRNGGFRALIAGEQIKIEVLHTNDISPWPYLSGDPSALGVMDVRSNYPIWAKWLVDSHGEPVDLEGYYFHGKHVLDIYAKDNRPLIYNVYFRGAGKSVVWWRNRGGADTFTERAYYDTNGTLSEDQVWLSNTWREVDVRNGVNGIVISGKWHQLAFDTNGMWTIGSDAVAR